MSESTSSPLDAAVQRILAGQAPLPVRSAAARGALPLPRHVLARLYLKLREDPDERVRGDATASLTRLAGESLREVLSDHGNGEHAICEHGNGPRSVKTVFWCVADVTAGEITYGRGNPCDSEAQVYSF